MPDYTFRRGTPPPERRIGAHRSKIQDNLAELAKTPGEWGVIVTYTSGNSASSSVSDLRKAKKAPNRPDGTWEFRAVRNDADKYEVWARLVPDSAPEVQP
jgi:hypothetical protein